MSSAEQVDEIAALARRLGVRVGVAESLTCGKLSAALGAGPGAAVWYAGGLVAYASAVKFDVLGVTPGPVVSARCAREMALGAARLLGVEAVLATTGVGGPDHEEGRPPGTVYVATAVDGREDGVLLELGGEPEQVLAQTVWHGLDLLRRTMAAAPGPVSEPRRPDTGRDAAPAG
jgi:nicotinamide-nucleotide amidase